MLEAERAVIAGDLDTAEHAFLKSMAMLKVHDKEAETMVILHDRW
jgi:hypothetical protein